MSIALDSPTLPAERLAYSVRDAAAVFGKKPLFIYRKVYDGTLKICADFGQIMIPADELQKLIARTKTYEPRKNRGRPKKV